MAYNLDKEKQDYTQAFYELLLSVMTSSGSSSTSGGTGGGFADIAAPRLTLVGTVKLKIDELQGQSEGTQFINLNAVSNVLDLYINGLLDECAKHILQTAPLHVINPSEAFDAEVISEAGNKYGIIILPPNYLRWVSLKMESWQQEVARPIVTTDPKYKLQKYAATRGGIAKPVAVMNSYRKTNAAAVAQVDTVTLSGTNGSVNIIVAGLTRSLSFNTDLATTAAAFVTNYAAEYLAEGVIVTSLGEDIVFTANVAGTPFSSPWVITLEGDLVGSVANTTANVPLYEAKRIVEYYSVADAAIHNIEKFLFIEQVGAEFVQSNLTDAITWLCAGKILQIMGNLNNQANGAEKAMAEIELCYKNLL